MWFNGIYKGIARIHKVITDNLTIFRDGRLVSNNYLNGKKSGVFIHLNNTPTVTCTAKDTYYPLGGTYDVPVLEDFLNDSAGKVKYNGSIAQHFEIDWHLTLSNDTANHTISSGITVNGQFITASKMSFQAKLSDQQYHITGTAVIELQQGDEVEVVVASDTAGDILTINAMGNTYSEFFD